MALTGLLLPASDLPLEPVVCPSLAHSSVAQLCIECGHHVRSASSASNTSSIHSISESGEEDDRTALSTSTPLNGPSGLDKLFAKLATPSQAQPSGGTGGSETTAASLLASISGPSRTMSVPPPSSSAVSAPTRGLALLDTIFASATPPPPRPASRGTILINRPASQSTSHHNRIPFHSNSSQSILSTTFSQAHHILSPKPTSTALPQVLNQEVISTLLGLPPSRASSVRYEGDNEASDDGASEPGSLSAPIPQLSVPTACIGDEGGKTGPRILGDVTPRPALRGFGSDINQVSDLLTAARIEQQNTHVDTTPSGMRSQTSTSSIETTTAVPADSGSTPTFYTQSRLNSSSTSTSKNPPKSRPLVPFETDSELWPYPRPPLVETDSDVIELDFADTSALSDPDAFEKHAAKGKKTRRSKKDQQKEREEIEKSWDVPVPLGVPSPTPGPPAGIPNGKSTRPTQPENATNAIPKQIHPDASKININGAQSALLTSLTSQDHAGRLRDLSRKDFVTEVLSLIYVRPVSRSVSVRCVFWAYRCCVLTDEQAICRRPLSAVYVSCGLSSPLLGMLSDDGERLVQSPLLLLLRVSFLTAIVSGGLDSGMIDRSYMPWTVIPASRSLPRIHRAPHALPRRVDQTLWTSITKSKCQRC